MTLLRCIISGRVQGVGFRWFVQKEAEKRGITGHAKNLNDGTVEVMAYGEKGGLEELLDHCRRGASLAHVNEIHVEWSEVEDGPNEFEIR